MKQTQIFIQLVVSTNLKNISQNGSFPEVGMKIKNIWNNHPVIIMPTKTLNICKKWNWVYIVMQKNASGLPWVYSDARILKIFAILFILRWKWKEFQKNNTNDADFVIMMFIYIYLSHFKKKTVSKNKDQPNQKNQEHQKNVSIFHHGSLCCCFVFCALDFFTHQGTWRQVLAPCIRPGCT